MNIFQLAQARLLMISETIWKESNMAQYIPLETLLSEINKRIIDAPINYIGHQRVWAYNDVKDIINTLEVKEVQEESVSEDLEQAAIDYDSCRPALYGEDDEGDYVEYIEVRKDAFIVGAKWDKEQMMKNAIPIKIDSGGSCGPFNEGMWIQAILLSSKRINLGDKYKHMIIEVKED